jgi:molybdopterin molybdotransferase
MMSVDEARARMLANLRRLAPEEIGLEDLAARTLAEAVCASRDQPPFNAAVMDGYALRAVDTPGDLRIVGESAAGHTFARALSGGEAVRISTGAPLPAGADAVIAQEDADVRGAILTAPRIELGAFVRPRGGDFRAGDRLLDDGRVVDASAIIALAGAGCSQARVTRKPLVSILANGDELVSPGAVVRDDQIFDAATYAVAALARAWGAAAQRSAPIGDNEDAIRARAGEALSLCDVLVLVGGASVGPHDHVRGAIRALGADFLVEGINVRPGRPTWFATIAGGACILGLPGNPASALACARLFLAPIIETRCRPCSKKIPRL